MCVHPTKSGTTCKREPDRTLCVQHFVNITLVPSHRWPGMMEAPAIGKFFLMNGDDVVAEFIPEPTPEQVEEYNHQDAERSVEPIKPLRRQNRQPVKRVKCGNCVKNHVEDPFHDNITQVKACYARRYRIEAESKRG